MIRRQYELLADLAADGDARLIANPGVLAARLVQEKLARPLASVVLQPWILPSVVSPPVMVGGIGLPRWAPKPLGHLYWRLLDAVGDRLLNSALHPLQASLGLPRTKRVFRWWLSPQRVIGMFPAWYGPPQPDWPPQLRLTGFPLYDGAEASSLSPELWDYCRAGEPPLAFTFGTGMMHAAGLFRASIETCRLLGRRGLLLTKHPEQLPQPLPEFMWHVEFAPFQQLFPRCAAVIHHGGVGTTARAMAAGVPQLILPFAFDQQDNGVRIKQLGVGDWLPSKRRGASEIAKALGKLLSPEVSTNCREIAKRFEDDNALQQAAKLIEEL